MRALFVGGTVDNSEMDLDASEAPKFYPYQPGGELRAQYRLFEVGQHGKQPAYVVYAAVDMDDAEVERIIDERDYPRRFDADQRKPVN